MISTAPLWPSIALAGVTFSVWITLFIRRIPGARRGDVPLELMRIRATRPAFTEKESAANDNLMNLFELPVLFHLLCLAMAIAGVVEPLLLAGCWAYVGLRAVHSVVHCSFNNVILRFGVYAASTVLLMGLWAAFAIGLTRG